MSSALTGFDPNRLSHAYILSGTNAESLAEKISAAAVCESGSMRPCGVCRHCRKAQKGIHPDIIRPGILPDKSTFVADQIRDLRADSYVLPNEADKKVYIFYPADKLSEACQNILLKTLEEPPSFDVFILITQNVEALLDTVRSRCVELIDNGEDEEPNDDANDFMAAYECGDPMALAEELASLTVKDAYSRSRLSQMSDGVKTLAMRRVRALLPTSPAKAAKYIELTELFTKVDAYLAANLGAGPVASLLIANLIKL